MKEKEGISLQAQIELLEEMLKEEEESQDEEQA